MLIISYLGQLLDPSKEHELFPTNEFGFTVKVKYNDHCPYLGDTDILNNVTEVHVNYRSFEPEARVAFESDVHRTGMTRALDYINEIDIVEATEFAPEY